jgi:hypothetical protein
MILDRSKLSALAKSSHNRCNGTGIYGYKPGTNTAIICRCVWRALEKQGVTANNREAVNKAIGREPDAQRRKENVPM